MLESVIDRSRVVTRATLKRLSHIPWIYRLLQIVAKSIDHSVENLLNGPRMTLLDLDGILEESGTLDSFLDNRRHQEEYFDALERYWGPIRSSRGAYRRILSQLREVNRKVPGFGAQVWRKSDREASSALKVLMKTSGLTFSTTMWSLFRASFLQRLRHEANIGPSFAPQPRLNELEIQSLSAWNSKSQAIDWSDKVAKVNFVKSLRADAVLRAIAARYYYAFLVDLNFDSMTNADFALNVFRDVRQNPRKVLPPSLRESMPRGFYSIIFEMTPNPSLLMRDETLCKRDSGHSGRAARPKLRGSAEFRTTLVRPFHALWARVPGGCCIGGRPGTEESLTPERWAISILRGAHTFFLEQGSRYIGFVQAVPFKHDDGLIYGSLEFWSNSLIGSVARQTETHDRTECPLFELWFPQFCRMVPADWAGLIVSDTEMANNCRIRDTLMRSAYYKDGSLLGVPSDFSHIDPLVPEIVSVIEPRGEAIEYCGNMVFDLLLPDAHQVTLLRCPPLESVRT